MVRVAQQSRGACISERAKDMHRPRENQVSRYKRFNILGLGFAVLFVLLHSPQANSQYAQEWVATLKSVEGTVEARKAAQAEWLPAALNDTYTIGDSIRVQAYSRAAILLPDETVLRLDQNTTVTFTEPQDETRSWLELLRGAIHVISRDPRAIKVFTPFAGAGLEGTEFLIEVTEDETIVTVFEGEVSVSTDSGDVNVASGQRVTARTGQQPLAQVAVRPRDAVQWTLYYAPILDYEVPAADEEAQADQAKNPLYYTGRASKRLAVGRVDEARADIALALNLDPTNVDALALQSIIAVAQNDHDSAFALANRALAQDPDSAVAMIALSYAQQAILDISGALITMQSAVERNPANGLGWARLSELWLAVGDLNQSLNAAQTAVSLNLNVARTQTVLGFAYLTRVEIPQAIDAFNKAILLDQAAPLPRLGLGLAKIRLGDLVGGRAEIEIAVILDPGNALIRSYMGKAYYEEKRDDLAESQFDISKKLDPLDPTPWFYDAIRKQTINRPVEALNDLQESIERNDNRAIYRSSLKLDQDLAARSASLGRIYRDLGFEQRALVEGWQSVNSDPSDHSGHRFLADTYSVLPRHEIARVSELLQSQLLQPINLTPVQPQLAETNLFVLSRAGPSDIAFNEFNPLFARDGIGLQLNGIAGDNSTGGNDLVISGINGRFSYSIGQFHYESDGFRENNDQERDIYNVFAQVALTPNTNIQAELRSLEADTGDLNLLFNPTNFSPVRRRHEDSDTLRLGLHHIFRPGSDIVLSLLRGKPGTVEREVVAVPGGITGDLEVINDSREWIAEIQHQFRASGFKLISGLGRFRADRDETETLILTLPFPPFSDTTVSTRVDDANQSNLYVYSILDISENLSVTLGLSADFYDSELFDRDQVNPKLGAIWHLSPETTVRAAAFRTLHRALVADQTVEPTQVAGFNQFFDGFEGDDVSRFGVAVDHRFARNLFGGIEISKRDLDVPIPIISPAPIAPVVLHFDRKEELARAYLNWAPANQLAFSAEYSFEQFDREGSPGTEQIVDLRTNRFLLAANYFGPKGWSASLEATFVDQEGLFTGTPPISGEDHFWILDASIGYRLPNRRGIVSLQANNLADEEFRFQDTDPKSPSVQPERLVLLKLTLSF